MFGRGTHRRDTKMRTGRRSCVIVVENLPVPFDRRVWQEAQALKADGWDVSVICPRTDRYPAASETIDGIHVYRHWLPLEARGKLAFVAEYSAALFHQLRLLWKIHRRHGFDVIQGCNPPDLIFLAALPFKLLYGTKYVFDHHDICPELFAVKYGSRPLMRKILAIFERWSYRVADHVVTANDTFRDLAIERTGKDPQQVTAVYSVPDSNMIRRIPADEGVRNGKHIVLGYLGVIGDQDGVDHLVRAVAHLKHDFERTDVGAIIVGDGPALASVERLAAELEVADDIVFTGYMTGEAMLSTIAAFDIGVIPDPVNEYNERISMNKVFEYSALGLPIVSYALTETRRLLADTVVVAKGDTPKDLAAAISVLCAEDALRARLGASTLDRARSSFAWATERRKYVASLRGVLTVDEADTRLIVDLTSEAAARTGPLRETP